MAKMTLEADPVQHILKITVDGVATVADVEAFNEDTRRKVTLFGGRPFGVLVDLRKMRPGSLESTERVKENQGILMKAGVTKSAEIVDNAASMLQLNRVAKESGLASRIQRFTDVESAIAWLREKE